MIFRHPCFDREAHCRYGRIHLPVAPACNIQCIYCKREYDCPNEARPGVCSHIETVQEAVERALLIQEKYPQNQIIGIAGPGEPLANIQTFQMLERLRDAHTKAVLCLSTNGLYLPEKVKVLKELGVEYLTVTMNAVSKETAEKIYTSVCDHGCYLSGREGAIRILQRQEEGIRRAVELGFHVKVNMVLMKGINTHEALSLAEKLSEWGVYAMNMNSVINVTGDPQIKEVSKEELRRIRLEAATHIRQIDYCRQCRADAVGIPGRPELDLSRI